MPAFPQAKQPISIKYTYYVPIIDIPSLIIRANRAEYRYNGTSCLSATMPFHAISKQEAQLMLTMRSTRLAVSRGRAE